jgi:hypothetical protein
VELVSVTIKQTKAKLISKVITFTFYLFTFLPEIEVIFTAYEKMLVNSIVRSNLLRASKPNLFTKSSFHNVARHYIMKRTETPIIKSTSFTPGVLFTRSFANAVTYKNTSEEYAQILSRTHKCGDLTSSHIGQNVRLCGWVKNFQSKI